jgi:predicted nucleic acid-binding protein
MKVLDATFLIDYLDGVAATQAFYEQSGGDEEFWVMPAPAYAEALVGVGNHPEHDLDRAIDALAWGDVYPIDETLSIEAARIAEEIGPQGPFLNGVDALVAAVSRELDAPVVSADNDLTHDEVKAVVEVEEYRE